MSALKRWGERLRARSVPEEILAKAPESPYGFPAELFRRRGLAAAARREPTPTTVRALEALPEGGSVLDVGVGGGATSLPLAGRAGLITGVDGQRDMLDAFEAAAREAGADTAAVPGEWPSVAERVPVCDVVVCGHVFYNIGDLEPFVRALHEHAVHRVVVELTEQHPLAWMRDLWNHFHDVRWPDGPTADDAAGALDEMGFEARREDRTETGDRGGGFERREDAIALVRRRLCLPANRDPDVVEALGDRLRLDVGLWSAGPPEQEVVTLWWNV